MNSICKVRAYTYSFQEYVASFLPVALPVDARRQPATSANDGAYLLEGYFPKPYLMQFTRLCAGVSVPIITAVERVRIVEWPLNRAVVLYSECMLCTSVSVSLVGHFPNGVSQSDRTSSMWGRLI